MFWPKNCWYTRNDPLKIAKNSQNTSNPLQGTINSFLRWNGGARWYTFYCISLIGGFKYSIVRIVERHHLLFSKSLKICCKILNYGRCREITSTPLKLSGKNTFSRNSEDHGKNTCHRNSAAHVKNTCHRNSAAHGKDTHYRNSATHGKITCHRNSTAHHKNTCCRNSVTHGKITCLRNSAAHRKSTCHTIITS